ncbi:MAG: cytochrome b5 domain-containing protein [Desulfobacterales bacterium]|nr:cytochrome b5 domain-containing protein [Desulfobacterales bacterium]
MQEFDQAELEKYDGKDGRPIYIAYKGNVYDVTNSKLWKNGMHMKRHHAGEDLTADIQGAPHEPDVLERYPQVGTLKEEAIADEPEMPRFLARLLEKQPFLRRHPHPMTVHFPIVFTFSTSVFNILYLMTGIKSLEVTALHCLAGGILFTAVGIATGVYTWWLNYLAKPMRPVKIKIPLTLCLLATQIILFVWRISDPNVLDSIQGASILYLLLVLAMIPMITVIGWFGASMTFPVEH